MVCKARHPNPSERVPPRNVVRRAAEDSISLFCVLELNEPDEPRALAREASDRVHDLKRVLPLLPRVFPAQYTARTLPLQAILDRLTRLDMYLNSPIWHANEVTSLHKQLYDQLTLTILPLLPDPEKAPA